MLCFIFVPVFSKTKYLFEFMYMLQCFILKILFFEFRWACCDICNVVMDHGDTDACANSFSSITCHQKSSHLSHHDGWNTAVTQQSTGIWPIAMNSQKEHSAPDTTILFSGSSLHSSTRWEEILLLHLSQPKNPSPLTCWPSSLSLLQQNIFPISTGANLLAQYISHEEL
jgi:hypothetical protein